MRKDLREEEESLLSIELHVLDFIARIFWRFDKIIIKKILRNVYDINKMII